MQTISIHAPREGGDSSANRCRSCWIHFNPRPPRGGRLYRWPLMGNRFLISIHAPREGGDFHVDIGREVTRIISIHAPREGGDFGGLSCPLEQVYFNPRPPRGGRPDDLCSCVS